MESKGGKKSRTIELVQSVGIGNGLGVGVGGGGVTIRYTQGSGVSAERWRDESEDQETYTSANTVTVAKGIWYCPSATVLKGILKGFSFPCSSSPTLALLA